MALSFFRTDPVAVAQQFFRSGVGGKQCGWNAVAVIFTRELWRHRKRSDGRAFVTFADFALTPCTDGGLGITPANLPTLRFIMFKENRLREWFEILQVTARPPGRPKNGTNGADFAFELSRSPTSQDSILRRLDDHPEILEDALQRRISIHEAGVRAGVVKRYDQARRTFSLDDLQAAAQCRPERQVALMRDLFGSMSLNAQCTFISRVLEPKLGEHLAKRWRDSSQS